MSKRILSLVLSLCLLCSMTAVALAADEVTVNETDKYTFEQAASVDITAVVEDSTVAMRTDVYSVEVVWGDMAFAWGQEYAGEEIWNPETHLWEPNNDYTAPDTWYMVNTDTMTGDWDAFFTDAATQDGLMIFNHSSLPVDAAVDFTGNDDDSTILDTTITPSYTLKNSTVPGTITRTLNSKDYTAYQLAAATESVPEYEEDGVTMKTDDNGNIVIATDNRYLDNGSHVRGLIELTEPNNADTPETSTDIQALEQYAEQNNGDPAVIAKLTVIIFRAETN